ncbi:MAG: thiamine-phosphate kinase [Nocardioidaceae bacterium]|nr:thiamine-phosphate kinase [Nocardioidaceae bacterium]
MPQSLSGTVGDAGEFVLVDALTSRFPQGDDVLVGPGDDAAVLLLPGGQAVVSVDMLVQKRDFRLDWSTATDIGHKAAAASMSDINAMGGRPTALLVALGAAPDLDAGWALELADGLAAEAAKVGCSVVGGDIARADAITISITAVGVCDHPVVRRSGAQPGDMVALAGRQGWAEAGLAVLGRGFRSPRVVVDAHRRPQPPYDAGPEAAELGATSMIDISDGLLQDLGHIASASALAIDVDTSCFEVPEPLQAVGAALGVDPMRFVLAGGEDFGVVATFGAARMLPAGWRVIGRVVDAGAPGVVTVDGALSEGAGGHQQFR